jgi:hypothetical protein
MQLDYETSVSIQFSVTCNASSTTTSTAQVDFRVSPVNEFSPVVTPRALFAMVREDIAVGTILVSTRGDVGALTTFSATDSDDGPDGELEYTLTFSENLTSFMVDEQTGTLTVTQNLDVDDTPFGFQIEVIRLTVCDIKPAISSCPNVEVSLVITSANDNTPLFDQDTYRVRIPESADLGSMVSNISCTDADVGAGAFSSVTSSNSMFNVTDMGPGEQLITLIGELDFESARSHDVTLTCLDAGGISTNATLLVTVEPVNDNPPQFTRSRYDFSMSRILTTGNEIGRVEAIDIDREVGGEVTYSMMDNENFHIQNDGSIILDDFVYVVEGLVFELPVTASDGEFSDNATVVITVTGVLSVPEIILTCMGAIVFLVLVIFIIIFCCYCSVCCSRL